MNWVPSAWGPSPPILRHRDPDIGVPLPPLFKFPDSTSSLKSEEYNCYTLNLMHGILRRLWMGLEIVSNDGSFGEYLDFVQRQRLQDRVETMERRVSFLWPYLLADERLKIAEMIVTAYYRAHSGRRVVRSR